MKTQEELNAIKEELQQLTSKISELSDDELNEIAGGEITSGISDFFKKIGEYIKKIHYDVKPVSPTIPSIVTQTKESDNKQ